MQNEIESKKEAHEVRYHISYIIGMMSDDSPEAFQLMKTQCRAKRFLMLYSIMLMYLLAFGLLMVVALITKSFFALVGIPILATEWAYAFRRGIDFLLSQ